MASLNFNEITNSAEVEGPLVKDPMFHWDSHYPSRTTITTYHRNEESPVARRRKRRDRNSARYKTQPITFDEIKEMDEDVVEDKDSLKSQFTVFSRSMDVLGKSPSKSQPDTARCSGDSSDDSSAATARQRFQQRRRKNMHNSIEEIPERQT